MTKHRVEFIGVRVEIVDGADSDKQAEEVARDVVDTGDFEIQQVNVTKVENDTEA